MQPALTGPDAEDLRRLADTGQYARVAAACQHRLGFSPNPALSPILALALARTGDREGARAFLEDALKKEGSLDFDARLDLAGAMLAMGELDGANTLLKKLITEQPRHPKVLARQGVCLMLQGRAEAARDRFEASAALDPFRTAVWANLASLALDRDDLDTALTAVAKGEKALETERPDLPDREAFARALGLHRIRLQCLARQGAFSIAEAFIQRFETDEKGYAERLMAYANALAEEDLHDQAREVVARGLHRFPENIPLLCHLAELARIQGHVSQAVRAMKKACILDEGDPDLWTTLALTCLGHWPKQARTAAEKALALSSELTKGAGPEFTRIIRTRAMTAMARVESLEEAFERSENRFLQVLAEMPAYIPALQGLARQYMVQGRIDEAMKIKAEIEKIDPLMGPAALAPSESILEDEAVLKKLEDAARIPSLEGKVKAGFLFKLAMAYDRKGEFHRAFEFAGQANAAGKKFLTYDPKAHRNKCFRIRERFSRGLFEHRKGCGLDTTLPVYVLGMPRSGTTLVEQIIAGHSRIFGAGELGVIPQRIQGLNRWERHVGSGRRYPDCVDDLTPYISKGIAKGILEELKALGPGAAHVVDKLPHNFENIGFIKLLFPRAKIISVRRDPRDIALSNYFTDYLARHGGMGFAYDLEDIGEHLADHNRLMHHWHTLFPGEILEIRYEEVVDDLEGSARTLLDYIGVPFEPSVLSFNTLERPVLTASVLQVRKPLYKTSKNRWKNYRTHLGPLIKGTNAPILPDPVTDMITLPVPGFLQEGVARFEAGDLDGGERCFKKMLHHNPGHAAAAYMTGLTYCRKGHLAEGADLMAKAIEKAPWHKEWRENLIAAYEDLGKPEAAQALRQEPFLPGMPGAGTN